MHIETLPRIEINDTLSVVGLNYYANTGLVKIFHHFRTIEENQEIAGSKHVELDYRHIPDLIKRLSAIHDAHLKKQSLKNE